MFWKKKPWRPSAVHNEFCRFIEFLPWSHFLPLNFYVYAIHLLAYLNSDCKQGPCLYLWDCAHQLPCSSINVDNNINNISEAPCKTYSVGTSFSSISSRYGSNLCGVSVSSRVGTRSEVPCPGYSELLASLTQFGWAQTTGLYTFTYFVESSMKIDRHLTHGHIHKPPGLANLPTCQPGSALSREALVLRSITLLEFIVLFNYY